jgi:hypothetical protein
MNIVVYAIGLALMITAIGQKDDYASIARLLGGLFILVTSIFL